MSDQKRFADPGTRLNDLATHFVVHCHKCDGKALINPYEDSWRLTCTSCFHVERPGHWYGTMTAYVCKMQKVPHPTYSRSDGGWTMEKTKDEM